MRSLSPENSIFSGVATESGPRFTTADVSRFFFGRSPHWLRWREQAGHFVLDGKTISPERRANNIRSYTLADIEMVAYALQSHGAIDRAQLVRTLWLLYIQGQVWGMLE